MHKMLINQLRKMRVLFLIFSSTILLSQCKVKDKEGKIMTVNGPVSISEMGVSLTHEHILVDFIGADSINEQRWDKSEVIRKSLPYLRQIKDFGCQTFFECTPAYLGRDPLILKAISDSTSLNIITNTGYYGAHDNKYIPTFAFNESAEQLAQRWITEWENGIGDSGIKPGFIKIAVDSDSLSEFHKKVITAAALTHLKTGLTIASHTGPAVPAFEQLELLEKEGVSPEAFIWVHAQAEKDLNNHVKAAQKGAWIGLDGLNDKNPEDYVRMIKNLRENNLLNKILLSHDAGWYDPAKENGGEYRGYTSLFEKLIPLLRQELFSEDEIRQLLIINPAKAFEIQVHKKEK